LGKAWNYCLSERLSIALGLQKIHGQRRLSMYDKLENWKIIALIAAIVFLASA
jgi:hypothetical protein